ncbi:hypothetical protein [Nocardia rhizosphaerae]|uniref:Uncharacterized protein n=1 Tax=Nocardia rhizosphaerae TaxID=1691571 RepID=A0ABV8LDP6_9NOCA
MTAVTDEPTMIVTSTDAQVAVLVHRDGLGAPLATLETSNIVRDSVVAVALDADEVTALILNLAGALVEMQRR